MTHALFSDDFPEHPRVIEAGEAAAFMWAASVAYCARHHTDGFVPEGKARTLYPFKAKPATLIATLLRVGLWERADGGYHVTKYLQHNPSAEVVKQRKAEAAARKAKWKSERAKNAPSDATGTRPERVPNTARVRDLLSSPLLSGSHTHTPSGEREELPAPDHRAETPESFRRTHGHPDHPPDQDVEVELGKHPALIADLDVRALAEMVLGRMMASGTPLADVLVAIGQAAADSMPGEPGDVRWQRVRRYTDNARRRSVEARSQAAPDEAAGAVLEAFEAAWQRGRRTGYPTRYTPAPKDPQHAAELATHARRLAAEEAARRGRPLSEDVAALALELVDHLAAAYMREDGAAGHLVAARHPLHLLARNIPTLGTPPAWARAGKPPRPAEQPAEPAPPPVAPPADLLARIGRPGAGVVARRDLKPDNIVHRDIKPSNPIDDGEAHTGT